MENILDRAKNIKSDVRPHYIANDIAYNHDGSYYNNKMPLFRAAKNLTVLMRLLLSLKIL
jgi:hypothetical protein